MRKVLLVDESMEESSGTADLLKRISSEVVVCCSSGSAALAAIQQHRPDIALMALPAGEAVPQLRLLGTIRVRYPKLPIVLLTADAITPLVVQALQNGATSFVPRERSEHYLGFTLDSVLQLSQTERRLQRLFGYVCCTESSFCLENDPALIAPLVSHLQENAARMKGMDEIQRTQLGIALHEGLLNAMYHGNLEVSSELRQLSESDFLAQAVERREISPYRERRIHVKAKVTPAEAVYVIRDEGKGFDLNALPDPTLPANLVKASGRGVLLMRTFVDVIRYNEAGNELTLIKHLRPLREQA
jgi:CheY-like chemotaxis protein